ncbi:MAG TPA: rRNA maturation RNase YbeY [Bacteroidetes bacterium]|nr:rRNA maturation RNase YbeY [Bacteroidota bacterium]
MAIFIHEQNTMFHVKQKRFVKTWLKTLVQNNGAKPGDINIILQSDEEILALNQQALQHDYYTDIITFNYNSNKTISGDLFISIDRIKENALTFASSTEEELRRVMAHGVLHLLGFNDKTAREQQIMRKKENEALHLFRELFHVKHE